MPNTKLCRMSGLAGLAAVVSMAAVVVVLAVSTWPAGAQAPPPVPDPPPDPTLPGSELITQVLGWLKYAAIASAVAGLLVGGVATGVGHFGANYAAAQTGRKWLLGGVGAALVAGLAHSIAMTVYNAT